ncbi:MAG TPA: hypothetical protein VKV16_04875, partial [Solirubrobacteraceae bacterium]|nr:hypothetical protein [Solirubrobacteraceae bacterium]
MFALSRRRPLLVGLAVLGLLFSLKLAGFAATAHAADAFDLDLETTTAAQEEKMLRAGELTSVELVKAYIARIAAINKAGAGLNAVTQMNPDAMKEARKADH